MDDPDALGALDADLADAPDTPLTSLARRLIEGAKAYDALRTRQTLEDPAYPGGIQKNFSDAVAYTADHVLAAPWADDPVFPLEQGESWNAGRRASLTGRSYALDERGFPVNPYLKTGIRGRGVIGLYGPNHAVDVGLLTVRQDEHGQSALYAYGIMKGSRPAFCGGFAEYDDKDENGYITGPTVWARNQAKEFFEEMVSGSVALAEPYAGQLEDHVKAGIAQYGGIVLPDAQRTIIRTQIETELKLQQIRDMDPDFLGRLHEFFQTGRECYAGPVRSSSRNTDTAWMETYLSWTFLDDAAWNRICGDNPVFDYRLAAGDDADSVAAHKIDKTLLEQATGTHSAMFLFMAASYLLDLQRRGMTPNPDIVRQMEDIADFLYPFSPKTKVDVPTEPRTQPVIWIIGATRSSKTALARALSDRNPVPPGFRLISTGDYFRQEYGQPDTFSRAFVFNLSSFSANRLKGQPNCHAHHLAAIIAQAARPCIVEGERNPLEFAKLYDPSLDMVFFLNRQNIDRYDTSVEAGVPIIEHQVHWALANGIAPRSSVIRFHFGNGSVRAEYPGVEKGAGRTILQKNTMPRYDGDLYPWIDMMIALARNKVTEYYSIATPDGQLPATAPRPAQ